VLEEGLLTEVQLNELLQLEAMTRPSRSRIVVPRTAVAAATTGTG
jgi:aspartate ammonia-lyase